MQLGSQSTLTQLCCFRPSISITCIGPDDEGEVVTSALCSSFEYPHTVMPAAWVHLLIRLEYDIGHLDCKSARHDLRSCDLPLLERTRTRKGTLEIGMPSTHYRHTVRQTLLNF